MGPALRRLLPQCAGTPVPCELALHQPRMTVPVPTGHAHQSQRAWAGSPRKSALHAALFLLPLDLRLRC